MLSGKVYNNFIRQQLYIKIYFTPTQLRSLFTAPVTILPGQAGIVYMARSVHWMKEAGTAYTLNGNATLRIDWSNGGATAQVASAGFMDQVGQLTAFSQGVSTFATFNTTISAPLMTAYNGSVLRLGADTADYTGGSGGLFVTLLYEQWPMVIPYS